MLCADDFPVAKITLRFNEENNEYIMSDAASK